nr:hypothetical protein [Tanacetum cinerariifolium]
MLVTTAQHKFLLFKLCQVFHNSILVVKIVGFFLKPTIQEEKRIEEEQAANAQYWKIPSCCDDDDDYNSAITPNEPVDSLSMGEEHLDTIPAMELDEFIKSIVENLVPNPSESKGENGCDVPACFTTFSNVLFDAEYESDSKEIIPMKIDQYHFNVESDLIEFMLNDDSSIILSSSKIDSLLDEFVGELILFKSILPRINKTDCYPEEDIRLIERLLYDNSSPRPPEEFVFENSNIKSFSPSPIPVEDSDSFMEEIDLFPTPDDPMPPDNEEDDDDSERDILIPQVWGNWVKLSDLKQALRGSIPENLKTLAKGFYPPSFHFLSFNWETIVQYSRKLKDSCQRILSSKSSFPQLQLGINLLHLAGSQPMLKSSYKAEDGVIISIPPFVGGVADVVVEIKGTGVL